MDPCGESDFVYFGEVGVFHPVAFGHDFLDIELPASALQTLRCRTEANLQWTRPLGRPPARCHRRVTMRIVNPDPL